MAQISFTDLTAGTNQTTNTNGRVEFFTLKNDRDEAVVRFMHDSVDTFDILTTHPAVIGGKHRRVNCLRNPYQPLEACPLCARGDKIEQKIYIRLIEYVNVNGTVVATPKVWERSVSYANTLKSYLDNYGPLSNMICKIIRHGVPGDMTTNYEIIPNLSNTVFPDSVYVKLGDVFKDFKALGTIVLDKNNEELSEFAITGMFPQATTTAATHVTANEVPEFPNGTVDKPVFTQQQVQPAQTVGQAFQFQTSQVGQDIGVTPTPINLAPTTQQPASNANRNVEAVPFDSVASDPLGAAVGIERPARFY